MELNYKKYGKGKPFVVLHGLFGSSDNWHTQGKKLSEYFEVYLIDQRNHGDSFWSDEFSYDIMADDLYEFIQKHQLQDIVLMGHSMGGKTAMRFAQKYPGNIKKLIVVDMGVKSYPITHDTIIEGLKSLDVEHIQSRGEADKQLSQYVRGRGVRMFLLKNLHRKQEGGFSWKINLPVLDKNLPEVVQALPNKKVLIDTLFISGGKSDYVLQEDRENIKKFFPLAEFHIIEDVGHWIHAEKPNEFIEEVLRFSLL